MESQILSLFLLMLRISLDHSPNSGYKSIRFSETLYEKSFEFVSIRKYSIITLNLSLVLLPADIDFMPKKLGRKRDTLGGRGIKHVEMVLA